MLVGIFGALGALAIAVISTALVIGILAFMF